MTEGIPPIARTSVPAASARVLLRWTMISLVIAAIVTVCTVLPAEYGIDPTGVGSMLGLTQMGKLKLELAREAGADAQRVPRAAPQSPADSRPPRPALRQ